MSGWTTEEAMQFMGLLEKIQTKQVQVEQQVNHTLKIIHCDGNPKPKYEWVFIPLGSYEGALEAAAISINALCREGWELVAVASKVISDSDFFSLRRPIFEVSVEITDSEGNPVTEAS